MDKRLGLCSAYSFLYGVHKPGKLLDRAAALGVKTVSVCDINNVYGVHGFLEEAKERNIRPIIGAALSLQASPALPPCLYAFVENREGFAKLCEILSEKNKDKDRDKDRNRDKEKPGIKSGGKILSMLREDSTGLVLVSASEEILSGLAGRVKRLYAAITPDDLGGIGPHRKLSLPLAFLDTSVFLDRDDYPVHRVLRAIGLNKTIGSLGPDETVKEGCGIFKSASELRGRLNSWPEAVRGTREIAELCQYDNLFNGFVFPSYGEMPGEELRRRVYDGASLRYGELGDAETERIEYELGIIDSMGFAPYFLRMDDIVKMAGAVNGLSRTCGRGSGAASVVSYTLGITNVDPIAHNLYFERFLNPSRPDPPDIDVDFAWDERDELIRSVIERFGPEYCARVANHNFFRPRSALRETAKAYGISDGSISQLERKLQTGSASVLPHMSESPLWKDIFTIARKIEGLPRGLGMHCGGLVITPEKISRYVPVEKSLEGFPLLAWEKEGTEAAGFVKIDLLGNRSLAVIRDALKNLEEEGIHIDPYTWQPVRDEATVEALARGDSMGVFYIESPAMRQLQKKTGKGDFEHIVIHSSLIRPAANKFINEYVRRLKGGAWKPLHPRLENILGETYGILCYQEDVSKTAVALAGFNEADADKLRKVIAKKAGAAKLAVHEKQFFDGCRTNGVDEETVKSIWAMMLSFDGYSFCKPHSASYAMVSFQSAYLRVHYPAEFMAAVISNQGGFYRPGAYISECRRMGLILEGPDVNLSRWRYYGMRNGESAIGNKSGGRRGTVVIGLMAIKGLSAKGADAVIKERERSGFFTSLEDFSRRVKPARDDIVAMCPAGVFDSISGLGRTMQARRLLSLGSEKTGMNNYVLFNEECGLANGESSHFPTPHFPYSEPDLASLWSEYRALGFLKKHHPLTLWKEEISSLKRIKARDLENYAGRYVRLAGWPVTQKEVWTKDGLIMSFLSFEDETALYETVVFPEIYDRYNKLLFDQKPLLVSGRVMNDEGAITVEISKIEIPGTHSGGQSSLERRGGQPRISEKNGAASQVNAVFM